MCYIVHMKTITIRELHLKTGAWVRATKQGTRVVVTERGEPVATLVPFLPTHQAMPLAKRKLVKGFAQLPPMSGDCSLGIAEDRDRR